MAKKRKTTSNSENVDNKRLRSLDADDDGEPNLSAFPGLVQPHIDPTYGQRGAFPGLDCDASDTLFYGPAQDGLEYLRMVRLEAKSVPNLLVAPAKSEDQEQGDGRGFEHGDELRGYYEDGAYTAVPDRSLLNGYPIYASEEEIDPQEAYYESLIERFHYYRSILHLSPPKTDSEASKTAAKIAASLQRAPFRIWRHTLLYEAPSMRVLAQLPQETVLQALVIVESILTMRNLMEKSKRVQLGAWCWGLLGRCREVGEMVSEEVGVLRNLGKKALALWRTIRVTVSKGMEGQDEENLEEESDGEEKKDQKDGPTNVCGEEDTESILRHGFVVPESQSQLLGDVISEDGEIVSSPREHHKDEEYIPNSARIANTNLHNLENLKTSLLNRLTIIESAEIEAPAESLIQPMHPPGGAYGDKEEHGIRGEVRQSPEVSLDVERDGFEAFATLDMIVTIIGESYGQRDLLDRREVWGEDW